VRFTSYEIPREEMGRQATAMLVNRIETGSLGSRILLKCQPVKGETLGPAPAASTDKSKVNKTDVTT
jgi:DNA-binding LacI/PurR family transcriptional regulator